MLAAEVLTAVLRFDAQSGGREDRKIQDRKMKRKPIFLIFLS